MSSCCRWFYIIYLLDESILSLVSYSLPFGRVHFVADSVISADQVDVSEAPSPDPPRSVPSMIRRCNPPET